MAKILKMKRPVNRIQLDELIRQGQSLSLVDTSKITDMSNLFRNMESIKGGINNWDVSSVVNMSGMFRGARFTTSL